MVPGGQKTQGISGICSTSYFSTSSLSRAFSIILTVQPGMAPERFGGGYDAISSMERSIHVRETTHVVQTYNVKNVRYYIGGGMHPPWSHPGADYGLGTT